MFVLAYDNRKGINQVCVDSPKNYSFSKSNKKNYNIEIDGRHFYDQPINDLIKQNDENRKKQTWQGDDYTAGCLLDYKHFRVNYRSIAADLSKQKALDTD